MTAPLQLPQEYAELTEQRKAFSRNLADIDVRRRALRKAAMAAAGWKHCCRCFPSCVGDDGFCGCCCFNHVTGKSLDRDDGECVQELPKP